MTCTREPEIGAISGMYAVERPKRANRCTLWLGKSQENVLILWFIHILQTVHLQQFCISSKPGNM